MALIRNRLNQRVIVNLMGGENIELLALGTASVLEEAMASPHLQTLLERRTLELVAEEKGAATGEGEEQGT